MWDEAKESILLRYLMFSSIVGQSLVQEGEEKRRMWELL